MMDREELIINYLDEEMEDMPNIIHENLNNNKNYTSRSELTNIKKVVDSYLNGYDNGRFNVLPGIRGVGKTTLLYETYNYLIREKNIPLSQILYISYDELTRIVNADIKEVVDIYLKYKHNTKISLLDKNIFLLVDEAQYDKNWVLSGKIIFDKTRNIFMIFTGSSALELEHNPDAARRMDKERINPLNYGEHLRLKYNIDIEGISEALEKLVFEGEVSDAINKEEKIKNDIINCLDYSIQ